MAEHRAIERTLLHQHEQSSTLLRRGMPAFETATTNAVVDCPVQTSQMMAAAVDVLRSKEHFGCTTILFS